MDDTFLFLAAVVLFFITCFILYLIVSFGVSNGLETHRKQTLAKKKRLLEHRYKNGILSREEYYDQKKELDKEPT